MRINPFLNLKSSAAGGEVCSGDCGKGERERSGSRCFSDAKVLLDYYRELRFYFSSLLDLQLDEIGLSSDVVPGDGWGGGVEVNSSEKREMFSAY